MEDGNQTQSLKESKEKRNDYKPKALSVKTNFVFSFIIQLLTYIIPVFTSPYLSRVLGPSGIGSNSFANSIVTYFNLIISFGFVTYGTKSISQERNSRNEYSLTFWNIVFTRALLFLFVFTAYFLMAYLWGFGETVDKRLFLVYSILLINSFADITYLFQGLENFRIISLINIISRLIGMVCIFVFVRNSDDLLIYVLIYTLQFLIVSLCSWFFAIPSVNKPDFKNINVFKCLKEAFSYFLPTIAISVYTVLDRTMLGYLSNTNEVAYYEEAYKIVTVVVSLINALSPVMLSRISSLYAQGNEKEIQHKINQMFEVSSLIAFPSILGLYAVSRYFFPAYFGSAYEPSVEVSYFLIPLILIIPISSNINSSYYVPRNKISMTTWFYIIGATTNFVSNFFAIRYMGAKGAALTSIIAESIISLLFIIFSRKGIKYKEVIKTTVKPLISAAVMFAVLMPLNYFVLDKYIDRLVLRTIISVITGVFVYGMLIVLLKEPMVISSLKKIKSRFNKKSASNDQKN